MLTVDSKLHSTVFVSRLNDNDRGTLAIWELTIDLLHPLKAHPGSPVFKSKIRSPGAHVHGPAQHEEPLRDHLRRRSGVSSDICGTAGATVTGLTVFD
jgi:hypothetical protein